jgi:Delta7-sterol 5-desaturase
MDAIKEIIAHFLSGYASAFFLNGTFIGAAYLIFWKYFKARFQNWRIQIREKFNDEQLKRELKNAVWVLAIGSFYSAIILFLSTKGYTKIYTDINAHSPIWAFTSFFVFLFLDDTWFYWCHRLLHHPRIYKYVHAEHHKSVDVDPFTSLSFHVLESFLLTFWIIPASFILPMYAPVLGILQMWGLFDNVKAHLGYELYPSWWNKTWLRFFTTSTHHNMHHSKFNGNYGVHFRFWDKLMGTEFADYEAEYDGIQVRKKA